MQSLNQQAEHPNGEEPGRSIPANINAEQSVLGSLLIDPDAIYKVSNLLQAGDFFRETHGWIFEAMIAINERREPIELTLLADELDRRGQLPQIGGPAYLTGLVANNPTSLYVDHYARIVERTAVLRRIIFASGRIAEVAYDESLDVDDVVNRVEQEVFEITTRRSKKGLLSVGDMMQGYINHLDQLSQTGGEVTGTPTGFYMLDRMLGGLQKSDLIIIAARPGQGKTSLALSIAQNAATRHGSRIALFSLEMSNEQIVQRLMAMETGVDSHRLRMGAISEDEWPIVLEAANKLTGESIYIDDTPAVSVSDIRTKCRRMHAERGLDMIIVDYVQLMSGSASKRNDNRQQEISYISRSLKELARELDVPVLALSQLSRAVENRADKRPMLSDLRESGSLEQDADAVLFIYREDYYIEDTDRQNIADILISKHRHGATGTVSLFYRKELTQFRDLEIQRTDLNY